MMCPLTSSIHSAVSIILVTSIQVLYNLHVSSIYQYTVYLQAVTQLLNGDEVKVEATEGGTSVGEGFATFCGHLIKAGLN